MRQTSSSTAATPRGALSNADLWQAMSEAEARKADQTLPLDVRVRSNETYSLCLREAHNRGYDYAGLRKAAVESQSATATQ